MNILVIDIGGTNVKCLATGQHEARKVPSGPGLTPQHMVDSVIKLTADWAFERISIGYPGVVRDDQPAAEPHNLGRGWVGFDFGAAFDRPVKVINDAAMQALGSYHGGKLLFLGLGTGVGSAMVVDGHVVPMELGHLPYRKGTFEDSMGLGGKKRLGAKKWRRHVAEGVAKLVAALMPDDVVLGGGNVKKLRELPPGCRAGSNANAFLGGFRIWDPAHAATEIASNGVARPRSEREGAAR